MSMQNSIACDFDVLMVQLANSDIVQFDTNPRTPPFLCMILAAWD